MRARELAVGPVPCLALRVTYVGELGWELYCPTEFGLALWDTLWEAGPRPRPRRRRLQGDRLAAPGEGLPRLGRRHHPRRHAVRGGARLRGQARQGATSSGARPCSRRRSRSAGSPASSSPTRAPSRSGPSRCGSTASSSAASRAAATATRSSARSRTRTCPAGHAKPEQPVEVEIFGEWVEGEVAPEPLFDPAGERLRG